MSKRISFLLDATARFALAVPVVALLGCNAILGASDYRVGDGNDGQGGQPPGQDGGTGNVGAGGVAIGSGGTGPAGGGPGAGGKGSGGRGAGGAGNPGTGGAPGGSSGTGSLTPDDFIGFWDTDAETITTDCGDGMPTTTVEVDFIEWTSGVAAGSIETQPSASCTVVATIKGRVATVQPAPPCVDQGVSITVSGTFTILADGTALLDQKIVGSKPPSVCTATVQGVFTKF